MSWNRARKNDLSALHSFLLEWEWKSVAFSSRLKKQEEACLPARRDAVIYLNRDKSRITGAILYTASEEDRDIWYKALYGIQLYKLILKDWLERPVFRKRNRS